MAKIKNQANKQTKSEPKSIWWVIFSPLCQSAILAHRLRKRYKHCAISFCYTMEGVAVILVRFFVLQDGQDQTNKQTKNKPKSICCVILRPLCQSAILAHHLRKRYKHCTISFRYTMEGVAVILVRFLTNEPKIKHTNKQVLSFSSTVSVRYSRPLSK